MTAMLILAYFATFSLFSAVFTREVIAPASGASCDRRWRVYAGGLNVANFVVVVAAGCLFNGWIRDHALFHLSAQLDPFSASLVVFLAASFIAYWHHRLIHNSDRLWRWVHQLHHSPTRIEALTAFYIHPLDGLLATLLNAVVAYGLLGAQPEAAALALFYVTVFNLIAHADQKTPLWLGFLIQRPEMHRIHHERGSHRNNYGLPLWDMMFGTWRNPRAGDVDCGFPDDKERLIGQMLLMRDVDG